MLLDKGAQTSFITAKAAQQLKIKMEKVNASVTEFGSTSAGKCFGQVVFTIQTIYESELSLKVQALVVNTLTNKFPRVQIRRYRR